jgi:hypothetical protein
LYSKIYYNSCITRSKNFFAWHTKHLTGEEETLTNGKGKGKENFYTLSITVRVKYLTIQFLYVNFFVYW